MAFKDLETRRQYETKYRKKNRDKINARFRKWYKNNLKHQKTVKEYREKNKERILKYFEEYRKKPEYKEKFNLYMKNWMNNKIKTDPHFKLKVQLTHRIYSALKVKGISKSKRTMKLLGCTVEELLKHLESKFQSGMTKENYGKWHVDHIRPCASFDLTDPKQQSICFHYTNLQPLWAKDNIRKGAKYENRTTNT